MLAEECQHKRRLFHGTSTCRAGYGGLGELHSARSAPYSGPVFAKAGEGLWARTAAALQFFCTTTISFHSWTSGAFIHFF